jgi:hypothetical protein
MDNFIFIKFCVGAEVAMSDRGSTLHNCPDQLWSPPSLLFKAYEGRFKLVRCPRRETNHTPPSNAEVKSDWIYTSTPPYICMECTVTTLRLSVLFVWYVISDEVTCKLMLLYFL